MEYSRLEEVQSVIPTTVRVLALTATATISTRKYIIKSLNMQNPEIVYISPMNIVMESPSLTTEPPNI